VNEGFIKTVGDPVMSERQSFMSDPQVRLLIEQKVATVLRDAFSLLGFDVALIADVNTLREDLCFAHRERTRSETRRSNVFKSTVPAIVGTLAGVLMSGITFLTAAAWYPF
jgi:hypothetical protein